MPSIFSRKPKGANASISVPFSASPYERTIPGNTPYPLQPTSQNQYPPPSHSGPQFLADNRVLAYDHNTDSYPPQTYGNIQREGTADPSSSPGTAHDSPNIDQRDPEPKRSFRERLGLSGANSRENLLASNEDQSPAPRLSRKVSSARRNKNQHNISPQSPPSSGSGRATPQLGNRRPVNIPEDKESEAEGLHDLATFLRTTAPSSDPKRRPISLVGDSAGWSKNKVPGVLSEEDNQPRSRPRSGSLGDPLERGSSNADSITEAHPPNPHTANPADTIAFKQTPYQAYHPQPGHGIRQQPTLPPLQTQQPSRPTELYPQPLSPSRQQQAPQQPLSQHPLRSDSPLHFEVQGPDQQPRVDSLEHGPFEHGTLQHGAASELSDHLNQQRLQQTVSSPVSRSVVGSPAQEKAPGMPSANLQLPPRRASPGDGNSEPPTPNAVSQAKMSHPPHGSGVQRAQTQAESTGRMTPPPQHITAKDMTEDEVNALIAQFRELREKYSKVKRYYFEKDSQVTTLQNALAHQKLSQSRTSLDDGEYVQRLSRLDGLISQLAFGFRKDWKSLPPWLQPWVNKDCISVGKHEMTAIGRAFISKWLVDEVFNKYFHPGLDLEVSRELKTIQNNIRSYGTALQTGEEEDALTSKIINWRLATMDGLQPQLGLPEAAGRRQHLIEILDAQLVTGLTEYMHETPAGLEGGVHMIIELAVTLLLHLPFESRDVVLEYYSPGSIFDERTMRAESSPIAPLGTPMAEPMDMDRMSLHSDRSEEVEDEPQRIERPERKQGFLKDLMSTKKSPPPKGGNGAGPSQNSLLQPPGSSGGPKDERVRLCIFLGLAKGKMVLAQAPVFKTM